MLIKSVFNELLSRFDQILAFDVETTGLDKLNDEIIELAFAELEVINDNLVIKSIEDSYILLDNQMIPEIITNLTGITDSFLGKNGVSRSLVAQKVKERLALKKTLLIAHNANFDYNFLLSMLRKENCTVDISDVYLLDTLTIFKDRRSYPHKLSDAINAYDLTHRAVNSHRAIDDAIATVHVLNAMYSEYDDINRYINIIGINPKYGIKSDDRITTLTYCEQPYNDNHRLYELHQPTLEAL